MAKTKLTEWFPANVKPARAGAYEVGYLHYGRNEITPYPYAFHYFDGTEWVNDASDSPRVMCGGHLPLTDYMDAFWRGLAENPTVRPTKKKEAK